MNKTIKKATFLRDDIWLNKTYSQHIEISQVDIITSELEEKDVEEEEVYDLIGETHDGPPPPR
jgi:hypothetical protein